MAAGPLGLIILALAAGILAGNRFRILRWLCAGAVLALLAFSTPRGSGALLRTLENQYPDSGVAAFSRAQSIVVLGGSIHMPSRTHSDSALIDESDRILQAFRLYRAGKAPMVVCSGGGEDGAEARIMGGLLQEWGVPPEAILLEDRSLNTRENALFSYAILNARGIRHILLVTSAIHMPRAVAVFRKAGFSVSPAPADFRTGWGTSRNSAWSGWVPEAGYLGRSDRALREWIGLLVYRLRGWI